MPVEALLRELNSVPGVIGSMVCDQDGQLVAHAFPPTIDAGTIDRAAAAVSERATALQAALGPVATIDLRYTNSRIVVKATGRARVLFLCAPSINLQLLTMSAIGVLRQIERLEASAAPAARAATEGGQLYRAVQLIEGLIRQSGGDQVKLRGQIALKAGFTLDLMDADTPDDPVKLQGLRAAARAVLGQDI
ncbi:MAG TPA: roadblock/LC7 domain-containing protein [Anaeromyxobacteraceae bacterium]|nr:roadblock/LC7 domain-containing protein [Anaeromyxobacteraceae bacterium]